MRTTSTIIQALSLTAILLAFSTTLAAKPAHVILIRHAEKPVDESDNHLTLKGRERAAALVPYFMESEELPKIAQMAAIYAQKPPHPTKSSLRPIETVQPLADSLKMKLQTTFKRDQVKELVQEVMTRPDYEGKTVLICWEHKVLLEIANEFQPDNPPKKYPGEKYDRIWIIKFHNDGKPTFKDLPQKLMFGDSKE